MARCWRTRDHSRVQHADRPGRHQRSAGGAHPERNKIYGCLGGRQTPEIEFSRKTPLEAGDVLACAPTACGALSRATCWRLP
jgi:serine/threonine protein phosphatase PrpC